MPHSRMYRYLIAFLFAFVSASLRAQSEPAFTHEFGAPGQQGSFRVKFDDRGAGIYFLQLMDHFATPSAQAKKPEELTAADYMLLVGNGSDYSLLVREVETSLFDKNPWDQAWSRSVAPGAVSFAIESSRGLRLTKTFRHRQDQRGFAIELKLENLRLADAAVPSVMLQMSGPAIVNRTELAMFGTSAWAVASTETGEVAHVGASAEGARQDLMMFDAQRFEMTGSSNRFFGSFLFPMDEATRSAVTRVDVESLPRIANADLMVAARSMPRTLVQLRLPIPVIGSASTVSFGLYLGPKSFSVFDESPEHARFSPILDVDLEPPCCGSIVIPGGRFMATMLVKLLGLFHGMCGVWGVSIMLLTILVRGCLAPLNFRMQKSMRAYGKRMAVVKPKLDKIKEQYADDPKAYQQAMIAFQRENKLMPPLGGCLPIFLTMPIYIGLFTALRTAYDLRHQGFLFMGDLSAPDMLFGLPFWPGHFNILPLVWISLMLILQSKMPLPTDPQQRQMQQIMRYMPLMFGVLLYNYAAGLMVYMVTSMVWTFGESAVTKKILGPIDPNAAAMAPTPMM